jgi:hypothetical protein
MTPTANGNDVLRSYLLCRLTAEARETLEARIFSDDQVFWERLCLEEEQLIDDYAAGRLDDSAREDFEQHFLSTDERRAKLDFVRALREHVQRKPSPKPDLWAWLRVPLAAPRWALALAATVVLALPAVVWQLPAWRTPGGEVSAWLPPELVRAEGEIGRVRVPSGCQLIRFHLDPGLTGHPAYRATLHEVTGEELWSRSQLTAARIDDRLAVTLTLPCELLPEGDYFVRLLAVSPGAEPVLVHRYDVRVLRE